MDAAARDPHALAAKEAEYAHALELLASLSDEIHTGDTPEAIAQARMKLHQDIHTHRRRRAHNAAVSSQPVLSSQVASDDLRALVSYLRRPAEVQELVPGGLDMLALDVKECESEGDFHNLVFALARFYRKSWLENHWGDIAAKVKR